MPRALCERSQQRSTFQPRFSLQVHCMQGSGASLLPLQVASATTSSSVPAAHHNPAAVFRWTLSLA